MEAGLPPEVEVTVERIHCSPLRIVLYLGGGASQVGLPAAPAAAQLHLHNAPALSPPCQARPAA